MAADDITIIDNVVGTAKRGFRVRVGEAPPRVKVASYLGTTTAGVWAEDVYSTFEEAYDEAVRFRNNKKPMFKVRADCTLP